MLLRLAYLAVANTFSLIRLLPMPKRELEAEILVLRLRLPNTSSMLVRPHVGTRGGLWVPKTSSTGGDLPLLGKCSISTFHLAGRANIAHARRDLLNHNHAFAVYGI